MARPTFTRSASSDPWSPVPFWTRSPVIRLSGLAIFAFALVVPSLVRAAWPSSPTDFFPICRAIGTQAEPAITPDGSGGAIICWADDRNPATGLDIFAQRVTASGALLWATNGVQVCGAVAPQQFPVLIGDGAGGAILVWTDYRNGGNADVWAQRVGPSGAQLWQTYGIAAASGAGVRVNPDIVSDGAGGAIIAWEEYPTGGVRAQRISAGGARLWAASGVQASSTGAYFPSICADGAGGALLSWENLRNAQHDIYAQRVTSTGAVAWTSNGVPVSQFAKSQRHPKMIADGNGGGVITWEDYRSDNQPSIQRDIYAQRISGAGTCLWTPDGVGVCVVAFDQYAPVIVTDGAGGGIIAWTDSRTADQDVYAQRVSVQGVPLWTLGGVQLSGWPDDFTPRVAPDGSGGAVIAWEQRRGDNGYGDIYGRRLNALGVEQWIPGGTPICTNSESQSSPAIASDGFGGAIVVWAGEFAGSLGSDIGAQRIKADGPVPVLASLVSSEIQGNAIALIWQGSGLGEIEATVYRRTGADPWMLAGLPRAEGPDQLIFVDRSIVRGQSYAYRLGYREGGTEAFTPESWVDVPAALTLSLETPTPNPVEGDLIVSFSLPSSDPARLRVFDVAGRVVIDREVGALGPGHHLVRLREANRVPPGACLISLDQSGRTIIRRAVFVR